jgi:hypothetical protein
LEIAWKRGWRQSFFQVFDSLREWGSARENPAGVSSFTVKLTGVAVLLQVLAGIQSL